MKRIPVLLGYSQANLKIEKVDKNKMKLMKFTLPKKRDDKPLMVNFAFRRILQAVDKLH